MNDQNQHVSADGRIINVNAYGDNANEIELSALDEARAFFGPDVRLEVINDYRVYRPLSDDKDNVDGKKYRAGVQVRALSR